MKTLLSVLLLLVSLCCACGFSAEPAKAPPPQPNPKLLNQPENTWVKVAPMAPAPHGILAYSGGAFDPVYQQFLIFGGGHADYWGNEVCAFSTVTLTWKKMYEPDAENRYTSENIDNTNGKLKDSDKPYTRHSYNQICYAGNAGSLFIFGGCGPGWGSIKPTCPVPPDSWVYSLAENKWTQLSNQGAPGGYANACCYDSKRNVMWSANMSKFDFATKAWTKHAIKRPVPNMGGYNFQMEYLAKTDRVMLMGSNVCTINPDTLEATPHPMEKPNGKGGLTYLPNHNVALFLVLPGGETGGDSRLAVFDCATEQWKDVPCEFPKEMRGAIWDRFQYDPVNNVALLVVNSGVWSYKPPKSFATPTVGKLAPAVTGAK